MKDDRLPDVLRIYGDALAREGETRAAYLDTACGADTALRREVEALLAEPSAGPESLLDKPPGTPPRLTAGQRLGPYEILGLLGAGGMGMVYKARDTRLNRTVALKIPSGVHALDPAVRDRFTREAHAIAALDHPHICTLYDVGREGAVDYFVMEHLEGETLATRLKHGALPMDQALAIATAVAEALAAAHRQGIVHRDLKPANVMLATTGAVRPGAPQVKLLDFGLAKLTHPSRASAGGATAGGVLESATTPGAVIGTVPYMAPEQLEGKAVDARTDVFAFGCVFYEMLTGRRAFPGDTSASVISGIMTADPPPVSTLQPLAPRALDDLLRRCLARDRNDRWSSASDIVERLGAIAPDSPARAEPRAAPCQS